MTSPLRIALGTAAALGALALVQGQGVAADEPGSAQVCLRVSHIQSTRFADPHTLYLRADGNQYYRMNFAASCWDAANETLVIHPFANNDEVCGVSGLNISVRATGIRCIPSSLERLTPDEVAQLPPHDRP